MVVASDGSQLTAYNGQQMVVVRTKDMVAQSALPLPDFFKDDKWIQASTGFKDHALALDPGHGVHLVDLKKFRSVFNFDGLYGLGTKPPEAYVISPDGMTIWVQYRETPQSQAHIEVWERQ
ncbi:hypothetical protein D3C87_1724890 [compost metagenome]